MCYLLNLQHSHRSNKPVLETGPSPEHRVAELNSVHLPYQHREGGSQTPRMAATAVASLGEISWQI